MGNPDDLGEDLHEGASSVTHLHELAIRLYGRDIIGLILRLKLISELTHG